MSGVIYYITTGNDIYVGSTNNFKRRQKGHGDTIWYENSKDYNCKLYKTIRENNGEWEMTIYEDNLSVTKDELRKYEEEIRLLLGATLNSRRAYSTQEQYKEYNIKATKEWRAANKEHIREYRKVYNSQNIKCECGITIRRGTLCRHQKSKRHITLMTSSA